ncbi:MAG: anti-sigma factor [Anaerolineae bacterium]|nr:anti-sigma factor [Anaerolineae bacterium]
MSIEDQLMLYALGALDDNEKHAIEQALARDPALRAQLAQIRGVVAVLGESVPPVAPSAQLKRNLMARVDADRASRRPTLTPSRPSLTIWQQLALAWRRAAPVFALGAMAIALVSGLWAVSLTQQLRQVQLEAQRLQSEVAALSEPGVFVKALPATNAQATASASLVGQLGSPKVLLRVANLPALDPARTYEAWIIRDGKPVAAGVFNTDAGGMAQVILDNTIPWTGKEQFGVTIENAGGSPMPNLQTLVFLG